MGKRTFTIQVTNATPTLRGLRVNADTHDPRFQPGELLPWDRVERFGENGYRLVDQRGVPMKRDRRRVIVHVQGSHELEVAACAQARALRNMLMQPDCNIRVRIKNARFDEFVAVLACAAMVALLLVPLFKIWDQSIVGWFYPALMGHGEAILLVGLLSLTYAALFAFPLAPGYMHVRALLSRYVLRAKFTADALHVVRRDGSRAHLPWSELSALDGNVLEFWNGRRAEFRTTSRRVRSLLWAVAYAHLILPTSAPTPTKSTLPKELWHMLRGAIVGLLFSGLVLYCAAPIFPDKRGWLYMWLVIVAYVLLPALLLPGKVLSDRIERWYHKRKRRKERNARVIDAVFDEPATASR
ncbi:MAG: hypothetical protein H6817_08115 [Phycisphaerales bacterium]|nr:hypothetical protein [Phycisphaerales bacterium]